MAETLQSVLVCLSSAETVSPCPAGFAPAVTNAYLADSPLGASLTTNYSEAGIFWSLAFVSVICMWSLGIMFKSSTKLLHR